MLIQKEMPLNEASTQQNNYSIFFWKDQDNDMALIKRIYLSLLEYPEEERKRIKKALEHKYGVKSLLLLSQKQAEEVLINEFGRS